MRFKPVSVTLLLCGIVLLCNAGVVEKNTTREEPLKMISDELKRFQNQKLYDQVVWHHITGLKDHLHGNQDQFSTHVMALVKWFGDGGATTSNTKGGGAGRAKPSANTDAATAHQVNFQLKHLMRLLNLYCGEEGHCLQKDEPPAKPATVDIPLKRASPEDCKHEGTYYCEFLRKCTDHCIKCPFSRYLDRTTNFCVGKKDKGEKQEKPEAKPQAKQSKFATEAVPTMLNGLQYFGCWADPNGDDLPRSANFGYTPTTCAEWCYDRSYTYAGLQQGGLCYCGNIFGQFGAGECGLPCDEDSRQPCGGQAANDIFGTGKVGGPVEMIIDGDFNGVSTFQALLIAGKTYDLLPKGPEFTLLVPPDSAFDYIPSDTLTSIVGNKDLLAAVLGTYFIPGPKKDKAWFQAHAGETVNNAITFPLQQSLEIHTWNGAVQIMGHYWYSGLKSIYNVAELGAELDVPAGPSNAFMLKSFLMPAHCCEELGQNNMVAPRHHPVPGASKLKNPRHIGCAPVQLCFPNPVSDIENPHTQTCAESTSDRNAFNGYVGDNVVSQCEAGFGFCVQDPFAFFSPGAPFYACQTSLRLVHHWPLTEATQGKDIIGGVDAEPEWEITVKRTNEEIHYKDYPPWEYRETPQPSWTAEGVLIKAYQQLSIPKFRMSLDKGITIVAAYRMKPAAITDRNMVIGVDPHYDFGDIFAVTPTGIPDELEETSDPTYSFDFDDTLMRLDDRHPEDPDYSYESYESFEGLDVKGNDAMLNEPNCWRVIVHTLSECTQMAWINGMPLANYPKQVADPYPWDEYNGGVDFAGEFHSAYIRHGDFREHVEVFLANLMVFEGVPHQGYAPAQLEKLANLVVPNRHQPRIPQAQPRWGREDEEIPFLKKSSQ
eukprot:TRINITY_DN63426_c0_g2_i1.p1 TRINITY_DN63426_c0_g2~~TRINITY_DN63426_c0_g2_i1.p1  ORF type:complete len:882 (-),score=89.72 TRINITY_DN63426_c0_g2_i1:1651-4296(-)